MPSSYAPSSARLAFSPYLAGAPPGAIGSYADPEPQGGLLPDALAASRAALQRAVMWRLRELAALSSPSGEPPLPLTWQPSRRAAAAVEQMLAAGARPSEVLGSRSGPGAVDLSRVPPALSGLCLLGPPDLALALAAPGGQPQALVGKDWTALSHSCRGPTAPGLAPGASSPSGSLGPLGWVEALPRSLGVLPGLPALSCLPWQPPSLAALRAFFRDLHPRQRHVGVDDAVLPWFRDVKAAAARAVAAEGGVRAAAAFAVFGVPPGWRAAVWETALGLRRPKSGAAGTAGEGGGGGGRSRAGDGGADAVDGGRSLDLEDAAQFEALCAQALAQPMLLDVVVGEDVGPGVGDSQAFFLFEEPVRAMLLAFLRDGQVAPRLAAPPPAQLQMGGPAEAMLAPSPAPQPLVMGSADGDAAAAGGAVPYYPPCGALPHKGLALLAAPLCYMYDKPAASYKIFRAMYCRYWSKLVSLSAAAPPRPALPGLLRVFEALLQELDPPLNAHLSRLGLLPACLALPWICTAFAGALPVQEVLLLWDRVVGLDSLMPLPLLAVAVMCFRRPVLLACGSAAEVLAALADISQLRTVPLMQAVLFSGAEGEGEGEGIGGGEEGGSGGG
ncbi:hypothetical protein GPECTOR_7g1297 [Gonium pectorale]|uniref:Rab-GAP TBC domain-containing protein n=1 Tax=Gonium pectorale TaxID=33097 RepID=A0A150GUA5_GONPE|nr:hypothetical protein GPECTOR_7g1297 [Gonium pectorale]|eukprot:KXZ53401.1 hypothetical protein GPECTOR_7g1297 [Gonium pectorale]